MPKTEKCSDWAENLTIYSSRYFKNFSFYPFTFYLALLNSYRIKCVFNFQTFLTVLFYEFFFENGTLYFSFTSQEFVTVDIFEIYFATTEIWPTFVQKIPKILWKCTVREKKFKLDFSEIFHAYMLKLLCPLKIQQ